MTTDTTGPRSYRSTLGDLREHVRSYVAKQLLLPRQEIAELVSANLAAARWIGIAAALVLLAAIGFVVLLVTVLALAPQLWLGTLVLALAAGVAVALVFAAIRAGGLRLALLAIVGGSALVGIGALALLFFPPLVLSALLVTLTLLMVGAAAGSVGYRKFALRGPERSIRSVKETITWVKATLLGRSES